MNRDYSALAGAFNRRQPQGGGYDSSGIMGGQPQQPRPMQQNFSALGPMRPPMQPRPMQSPQLNPVQGMGPRPGGELGGIMGGQPRPQPFGAPAQVPMGPPKTTQTPWGVR